MEETEMTNAESKVQYEGAILQQLIKNAEELAVVRFEAVQIKTKVDKIDALGQKVDVLDEKVDYIYKSLKWIIGLLGAVFIAVLANLLTQPILGLFN